MGKRPPPALLDPAAGLSSAPPLPHFAELGLQDRAAASILTAWAGESSLAPTEVAPDSTGPAPHSPPPGCLGPPPGDLGSASAAGWPPAPPGHFRVGLPAPAPAAQPPGLAAAPPRRSVIPEQLAPAAAAAGAADGPTAPWVKAPCPVPLRSPLRAPWKTPPASWQHYGKSLSSAVLPAQVGESWSARGAGKRGCTAFPAACVVRRELAQYAACAARLQAELREGVSGWPRKLRESFGPEPGPLPGLPGLAMHSPPEAARVRAEARHGPGLVQILWVPVAMHVMRRARFVEAFDPAQGVAALSPYIPTALIDGDSTRSPSSDSFCQEWESQVLVGSGASLARFESVPMVGAKGTLIPSPTGPARSQSDSAPTARPTRAVALGRRGRRRPARWGQ
ncbi:unnamed protein product, partial [Prorocentrum cordatum]